MCSEALREQYPPSLSTNDLERAGDIESIHAPVQLAVELANEQSKARTIRWTIRSKLHVLRLESSAVVRRPHSLPRGLSASCFAALT